jgi:hypothetical protein
MPATRLTSTNRPRRAKDATRRGGLGVAGAFEVGYEEDIAPRGYVEVRPRRASSAPTPPGEHGPMTTMSADLAGETPVYSTK